MLSLTHTSPPFCAAFENYSTGLDAGFPIAEMEPELRRPKQRLGRAAAARSDRMTNSQAFDSSKWGGAYRVGISGATVLRNKIGTGQGQFGRTVESTYSKRCVWKRYRCLRPWWASKERMRG